MDAGADAAVLDAALDSGADASDGAERDAEGTLCTNAGSVIELIPISRVGATNECGPGCRQVTYAPVNTGVFDFNGNMLAYIGGDNELGFVDLAANEEYLVPVPAGHDLAINDGVAIHDGNLAFSTFDPNSGLGVLWHLDLDSRCLSELRSLDRLDASYGDIPTDLDVDSNWIVWFDQRWGSGRQDLFGYDLVARSERRLTENQCCVAETRISGTRVVYQGWADGPRAVHVLDLGGGGGRRVWENPNEQRQPAIQGSRVVFTYVSRAQGPFDEDIRGVDLETGEDFMVTQNDALQSEPDVYGDLVVWDDCRNDPNPHACTGNIDVYARDLAAGTEIQVTALPGIEANPRVWERTVYFAANIGGMLRVYAVDVP